MNENNIKNGGKTAGLNGQLFEKIAAYSLLNELQEEFFDNKHCKKILPVSENCKYSSIEYVEKNNFISYIKTGHSLKQIYRRPDGVYICTQRNTDRKVLKIVEIKYQNTGGSAMEKLFSAGSLKDYYKKYYSDYDIEVLYCLTNFYKHEEFRFIDVIEHFKKNDIKYLIVEDEDYQNNLEDFIYS